MALIHPFLTARAHGLRLLEFCADGRDLIQKGKITLETIYEYRSRIKDVEKLATIGFPHGGHTTAVKVAEAERALDDGGQVVFRLQVRRRAWGLFLLFGLAGWTPVWTLLAWLAAPLSLPIVRTIHRETQGPPLIRALKGVARLHLLVGILLAVGATIG